MSAHPVRPFGHHALHLATGDAASARGVAARLGSHPDIVAVVPAANSVLVHTRRPAALCSDLADLLARALPSTATLNEAASETASATGTPATDGRRTHVIPVTYDGEDLSDVADLVGMSADSVIARHSAATYTVDFIGFSPGYPYLSGLDPALDIPRLPTPRTRVPAGSVGLAAGATSVYPTASPGGWRLIGRTSLALFDAGRDEPSLLRAGDVVTFEPVRG